MSNTDPNSSLLTPRQRQVLTGESEISDRGKRAARSRIRRRLIDGMDDFSLLLTHLDKDDEQQISSEASRTNALGFLVRQDVRHLFPEPDAASGYRSSDEVEEIKTVTDLEVVTDPMSQQGSNLDVLQMELEEALRRALAVEVPDHFQTEFQNYDVEIDVDISVRFSKEERLNVMDLEHQLQEGELTFRELRQHYADSKVTMTELQQLTRDEEMHGEPTPEYRKELLSRPVPMLEGEPPEGYMRIRNTNTATRRMHDGDHMLEGYYVRFDDHGEAVVLEEVGEALIENFDTIGPVNHD